jgi:uncharacterized protein YjdB
VVVTGVALSDATLSVEVGKTKTLTATVSPANATNKAVAWKSSDATVATVPDAFTGTVVTISALKVGGTTVSVETADGKFKSECTVTVTPIRVSSITIDPGTLTIAPGGSGSLTPRVLPEDAANKTVAWSRDSPAVANVSTTGFVMGYTPGAATIRATAQDGSGVYGTCSVVVTPILVTSVALVPNALTLAPGGTAVIDAAVLPSDASNKGVVFSTGNAGVATIAQSGATAGVATAVAAGSATITATAQDGSNVTGTCSVTVSVGSAAVYAAGLMTDDEWDQHPAVWTFGEAEAVKMLDGPANPQISSIYAQEANVYVAGQIEGHAALWVNDQVPEMLEDGTEYSHAWGVTVGGPNNNWVRVVGSAGSPEIWLSDRRATVWRYSQAGTDVEVISNLPSEALAACYTAGYQPSLVLGGYEIVGGVKKARVWRESQLLNLYGNIDDIEIRAVCTSGSDIYSAGVGTVDGKPAVTVWKNADVVGTLQTDGYSMDFGGMAASGSDWYVAAYSDATVPLPGAAGEGLTIWKNGTAIARIDGAEPYGIFASGDDVYVTGLVWNPPFPDAWYGAGAVWRNGEHWRWLRNSFGDEYKSEGNAVFVK